MPTIFKKIKSFDGELLFVSEHSKSKKPTTIYLLLSGLGGCSTSWHFFIEELLRLKPNSCCVAIDLRGHGKSSHAFSGRKKTLLTCLAADLEVLVRNYQSKNTKLVFVGQSLGTLVLQEFIANQKTNPFAFIFLCAGRAKVPFFGYKLTNIYPLLSRWSATHAEPMRQLTLVDQLKYKNTFEFHIPRLLSDITIIGKVSYILLWLSILGWEAKRASMRNQKNVCWIFGKNDFVVRKRERSFVQTLYPDACVCMLSSNHNVIVNEPIKLAQAVASYF